MFKAILLRQWHSLSDPELEHSLITRIDFNIPSPNTRVTAAADSTALSDAPPNAAQPPTVSNTVYNIEVEDYHTYCVDYQCILAHNQNLCRPAMHAVSELIADDGIAGNAFDQGQ